MTDRVVIDDGHTATKVVSRLSGRIDQLVFPSKVVLGTADVGAPDAFVYHVDRDADPRPNQVHTLYGRGHPITVDNRHDGFPTSPANRVLVHHALLEVGAESDVSITTTLPLDDYYRGRGEIDDALIEAKRRNIASPCFRRHDVTRDGVRPPYRITAHDVRPEGAYALIDVATGWDQDAGAIARYLAETFAETPLFAIIDIGGRTTDLTIARWNLDRSHFTVDTRRSRTIRMGVMDAADRVSDEIAYRYRTRDTGDSLAILESRSVTFGGARHDVGEVVDQEVEFVQDALLQRIAPALNDHSQFARMIFCGGGAALFPAIGRAYPPEIVTIPDDPQFSNARGIMKYLMGSEADG